MPTFEDKVLQRAVAMVLETIYEQEFYEGSYGFRPGRGAHDAADALWDDLMPRGAWVLEIDIRSFFDTLDHAALRGFLDERVTDGVLRRTIDKWLQAGVLESGKVVRPDEGTPQGGVISPILANIYLHGVLDRWFAKDVKPRLSGRAYCPFDETRGMPSETDPERHAWLDGILTDDVLAERAIELREYLCSGMHESPHKLLGFANPIQGPMEDERSPPAADWNLLLQLESDAGGLAQANCAVATRGRRKSGPAPV